MPQAKRAFSQLQAVEFEGRTVPATITDCSIGFARVKGGTSAPTSEQRSRFAGVREFVSEAAAEEASLVTRGAVKGASVLAVRTAMTAGMVSIDAVVDIGRRLAAGELSSEEAQACLSLLGGEDLSEQHQQSADEVAAVDADIAEALAELSEALEG